MELAAIEQMRHDVKGIDCRIAAQITASIVETNKRIADRQKANSFWFLDYMINDGWDGVEKLEVPKC